MKALRFEEELKLVRDAPIPRRDGESLVQVVCAGICNTDIEIVKGYAGFLGTPGHEFAGVVVESPDRALIGRRVVGEINAGCGHCELCLQGDPRHCAGRTVLGIKGREGAFAEFLSLPARNLIELPDSIGDDVAVFVEPLAAACNILEQIQIANSTQVVVVGDGKLAQLIVMAMAQTGCPITVIGRHKEKLELARRFGARHTLLEGDALLGAASGPFDLAIEASGSPSGLTTALTLVKPKGSVVLKSTLHDETRLDMSMVVVNELSIIGSRCGRFQPAIDLLASGRLDVSALISRRFPLEEGLRAFEEAVSPDSLKIILQVT